MTTRTRKQAYELWIEALESGRYRRHEGGLRQNVNGRYKFCPLGVLCDLIVKDGGPKWGKYHSYDNQYNSLSKRIAKFMGLTIKTQNAVINLNDVNQLSLKKMAQYIREDIMPAALARA